MMIAKAKIIIPANTPPYNDPVSTPVRSATSPGAAEYNDQIIQNSQSTNFTFILLKAIAQGSVCSFRLGRV